MLIVSFVLLSLSSCELDFVDIDKKYDGLSIGFTYEQDLSMTDLCGAVRSKQTEFDINNVTLECSYGWYSTPPNLFYQSVIFEPVCVALYFTNGNLPSNCEFYDKFEEYQNLENMLFLKEISIEEFSTDAYEMKMTKQEGKIFDQKDTFIIPKEFFIKPSGLVNLIVAHISWNPNENVYFTRGFGFRTIHYRFIDEETVSLYK